MDEPSQSPSDDSASTEKTSLPKEQSGYSESDATVLTPTSALQAADLPAGMTPRELAGALQGEMLDHFKLQQFVGGGGMGVVFKALDTTLDRVVAVKVVASRSISNEDLQRRFLIEAQSAARLDHPNIARVYDSGRSRGLPYIVFEYIEGANIRDIVVNHGPLPLGDALSFSYQIAHALAHAWQRDVVHRDIKPSNILVNQEGLAKLVDMGLARLYQVGAPEEDLTNTGVTLGTFDYISPEQARDPRLADARSDIYSLGCTLFYMLAGHAPFSEGTAAQKLLKHQEDKPPELQALRDDIPESLDRLVRRMLAKRPEERPQSSTEVVKELGSVIQEIGLHLPQALSPLPSAVSIQPGPNWQRHIPWVVPVIVLFLMTIWLSPGEETSSDMNPFPAIRKPSATVEDTRDPSEDSAGDTSIVEQGDLSAEDNSPKKQIVESDEHGSEQADEGIDVTAILEENGEENVEPVKSSDEITEIDSSSAESLELPTSDEDSKLLDSIDLQEPADIK